MHHRLSVVLTLSPLLCRADILFVQVEGEDSVGGVRLQAHDLLQDVVQRAVEEELIEPIRWKDVRGWQLRRSDGTLVSEGARRSVLLEKLLPFPSECLLIITRLTSAAPSASLNTASSSSSSSTMRGKIMHWPQKNIMRAMSSVTLSDSMLLFVLCMLCSADADVEALESVG
jgi:hypothetical protein